jgi:hypothetical protein
MSLLVCLAAVCLALYGCGGEGEAEPAARPIAPAAEGQTVVWAAGDGADGSVAAMGLAGLIARDRPARFLYLGDVYPAGTAADFRRNYASTYGRLRRITEPTPGNHEWGNRRRGYLRYWRAVKGRRQPSYYSFRLAGWEFLNLNSETAHQEGSPQLLWLHQRLAQAPGTCRIAFWHRARYSAGTVHGDAPQVAPLWRALRGRARLVLTAHEHNLQRFHRGDGMTQYVSGAGGKVHYDLRRDKRLAFGRARTTGALRLLLAPGRATLEFRAASGRLLDRSRATCRP